MGGGLQGEQEGQGRTRGCTHTLALPTMPTSLLSGTTAAPSARTLSVKRMRRAPPAGAPGGDLGASSSATASAPPLSCGAASSDRPRMGDVASWPLGLRWVGEKQGARAVGQAGWAARQGCADVPRLGMHASWTNCTIACPAAHLMRYALGSSCRPAASRLPSGSSPSTSPMSPAEVGGGGGAGGGGGGRFGVRTAEPIDTDKKGGRTHCCS